MRFDAKKERWDPVSVAVASLYALAAAVASVCLCRRRLAFSAVLWISLLKALPQIRFPQIRRLQIRFPQIQQQTPPPLQSAVALLQDRRAVAAPREL
jgi:hypothetical protein